jgi:hypothetical protein
MMWYLAALYAVFLAILHWLDLSNGVERSASYGEMGYMLLAAIVCLARATERR